jgi:hypothetical protein
MHPFLMIGGKGTLAALRADGYKTFAPWVDETYDEESDPDLRIRKAWGEIERLCAFSEREIQDWYRAVFPVLEHNYEHYHRRSSGNPVRAFAEELFSTSSQDPRTI